MYDRRDTLDRGADPRGARAYVVSSAANRVGDALDGPESGVAGGHCL